MCAALLDPPEGGYFTLAPVEPFEVTRAYVSGTNVLQTTFTSSRGSVEVIEALNSGSAGRLPWSELARCVQGTNGRVAMHWELFPGTRFGQARPWVSSRKGIPVAVTRDQSLALVVGGADDHLVGRTYPIDVTPHGACGEFEVREGDKAVVAVVAADREPLYIPRPATIVSRVERTIGSWRAWTEQIDYDGPWRDQVIRSALALKSLLYEPGGAIAAAATTSLPEKIGGTKNWDYRFAWVRDSSFTVDALIHLGLAEEVHAAVSWLLAAVDRTSPDLHVFYSLGGHPAQGEHKYDLPGYKGSQPVRVGNAAARQIQLGNYGDFLDTIHRYAAGGHLIDRHSAQLLCTLADQCCDNWSRPDSGIWELPDLRHYTISKIGCWTALDRAYQMADAGQLPGGRAERWRSEAAEIKQWVKDNCWSTRHQAYSFFAGTDELDASVLLAGRTGFDRGPRLTSTIEAVIDQLGVPGSPLMFRYSGMEKEEGAFVACTFWLVTALAHTGQHERAEHLMQQAVHLANPIGLLSEQIDPDDGSFLGNIPQGLSHLALINAAHALADR